MTWNEQFKQEGRLEGQRMGVLMGQIILQREHLGFPTIDENALDGLSISELEKELERLQLAARNR